MGVCACRFGRACDEGAGRPMPDAIKFSDIFNGDTWELVVEEDFGETPDQIVDWEETRPDEELDPYETPTQRAVLQPDPTLEKNYSDKFPNKPIEHGWATLALMFTAIGQAADVQCKRYQHNVYSAKSNDVECIYFTFETDKDLGRL